MKFSCIMRYVSGVLGLALFGGWQVGALAVAEPLDIEPRLELRSLVREAMENNPDIRAAQQRWMSAKTVIPQVKTTWATPVATVCPMVKMPTGQARSARGIDAHHQRPSRPSRSSQSK